MSKARIATLGLLAFGFVIGSRGAAAGADKHLASPPANRTSPEAAWNGLIDSDVVRKYQALLALARAPEETVAFLEKQLTPVPVDDQQITQWLADLESNRFAVREKAAQELETLGPIAKPHLRKALDARPSLDLRRRVEKLLERLETRPGPSRWVRRWQAIGVLEHIANPEARQVLQTMAGGHAQAQLTQEAKVALGRLGKPSPRTREQLLSDVLSGDPAAEVRAFLALNAAPSTCGVNDLLAALDVPLMVTPAAQQRQAISLLRRFLLNLQTEEDKDGVLRASVQDAIDALEKSEQAKDMVVVELLDPSPDQEKIARIQREWVGEEIFHLGRAVEELEQLKTQRVKQGKRWRASYDYVLARLYAREASIVEYSAMLGTIRRGQLPQRIAAHKGWRLASVKDLHDTDGVKYAREAKKLLETLSREHRGTLWELVGQRGANASLGLEWQPFAE
jgi:hypothetical protein